MKVGEWYWIEWEDSNGCPMGWQSIEHTQKTPIATIQSVGRITSIAKRELTLTPHIARIDGNDSCAQGYITIPKSGILKTRMLKIPH